MMPRSFSRSYHFLKHLKLQQLMLNSKRKTKNETKLLPSLDVMILLHPLTNRHEVSVANSLKHVYEILTKTDEVLKK